MRGPFTIGEHVLLVDRKRRRHMIRLAEAGEFHTHAGVLAHSLLIGQDEGITVRTTRGGSKFTKIALSRIVWATFAPTKSLASGG